MGLHNTGGNFDWVALVHLVVVGLKSHCLGVSITVGDCTFSSGLNHSSSRYHN